MQILMSAPFGTVTIIGIVLAIAWLICYFCGVLDKDAGCFLGIIISLVLGVPSVLVCELTNSVGYGIVTMVGVVIITIILIWRIIEKAEKEEEELEARKKAVEDKLVKNMLNSPFFAEIISRLSKCCEDCRGADWLEEILHSEINSYARACKPQTDVLSPTPIIVNYNNKVIELAGLRPVILINGSSAHIAIVEYKEERIYCGHIKKFAEFTNFSDENQKLVVKALCLKYGWQYSGRRIYYDYPNNYCKTYSGYAVYTMYVSSKWIESEIKKALDAQGVRYE